ncbi:MAG: tubulin/FtsZ family protein [Methanoregula sp.]|nr:MAG: tubulin/FtsZ family protein [Methanoregula sp.]
MRILAIGLGGAGGRIVDVLYRTDRRSSKVVCVQALAVDVDSDSLSQLTGLPESSKIYFPPIDITSPQDSPDTGTSATIDIAEVTARVQTMATGETDAIFICAGLGGAIVDSASHIIAALRSSMVEPIFGLVTLPCLSEGEQCSAKAADDIEMLSPMLDGIILFDNETWYKKIKSKQKTLAHEDEEFAARLGFKKKPDRVLSPVQKMYSLLNDAIVRRISLILRAGEFKADGGIELAEVVLDSGEVLNTMKGMGFITIGYAVEQIPQNPLDFLSKLRPTGFFADEHQKRASRIVELAKQAIYHEISTPCDLTSAHKALVLIAGPSHELSLKGYMTVRKWIDRSIAGLETRSGDYPVTSTRFVAIIIMLTGLENIPRISEIKEIRTQYNQHLEAEQSPGEIAVSSENSGKGPVAASSGTAHRSSVLRDEMISVPKNKIPDKSEEVSPPSLHSRDSVEGSRPEPIKTKPVTVQRQRRLIINKPYEMTPVKGTIPASDKGAPIPVKKILASQQSPHLPDKIPVSLDDRARLKEQERKKIEKELQKQRLMAITGRDTKLDRHLRKIPETGAASNQPMTSDADKAAPKKTDPVPGSRHVIHKKQDSKKIVLQKKGDEASHDNKVPENKTSQKDRESGAETPQNDQTVSIDDWIRQAPTRKKDGIFEQEIFKLKDIPQVVRDDALLHTNLHRERESREKDDIVSDIKLAGRPKENELSSKKQGKKGSGDDDASWVR